MAQIEKSLGVESTYFVLLSSKFYNVLEGNNVSLLKQISRLGHEIGLHYHVPQYQSYGQNMKQTLEIEIKLLEHLIHRRVYSIARHNPQEGGRDPFVNVKGYVNADNPFLMDLFVSDGARAWRIQSLLRLFNEPPRRVQILIHPYHWQENKCDRFAPLEKLFHKLNKENLAHLNQLKQVWSMRISAEADEYNKLMKKANSRNFIKNASQAQRHKGRLLQLLNYCDKSFRWYVCGAKFAPWYHILKMKVYKKMKRGE